METETYINMSKLQMDMYLIILQSEAERIERLRTLMYPKPMIIKPIGFPRIALIRGLTHMGQTRKLNTIKALREVMLNLGLKEAKDMIDGIPSHSFPILVHNQEMLDVIAPYFLYTSEPFEGEL